jgi:hypothetical protein
MNLSLILNFQTFSGFVRLKSTWDAVDQASLSQLAVINAVFSHQKNFAEYRRIMSSVNGPCAG